jgi:tetratricopeptide (TPR) repeat protein
MLFIALLIFGTNVQAQKKDKQKEDAKTLNDFELKERKAAFMDANKQKMLGNPEEAAELYRKAIKIDPNHDASMFELARIYQYQNRVDDAIVLVNNAIEINDNISWYYLLLSDLYKKNREYEKVVEVFNRLIIKFPDKIEYRYELAHILTVLNEYKDAIACYDEIEDIIGISEEVSLKKRALWTNLGKENKALDEIERLAEAYPGSIR